MTKEQLLEQMEMDQMIAQAEMAGDPYIQDDRVQLSAPPRGTGDDMYRDMGAIDPSQMNTGAGDMGGIEPETLSNALSNEELIMAEEFMNALPKEAHESFIDRLINDPKATIMSIMDTLGDAFGGGSVEGDPNPMMGSLGSIGSGSTSNAELDAYRNAMNVEGSGEMTDFKKFMQDRNVREKAMKDSKGSISDMELMRIVDSRDGYQPPDSTNLKGPFSEKEIGSMQSTRPLPSEERLYQLRRGR